MANVALVRNLGADIVIEYKKEEFSHVLRVYEVVLNHLDKVTFEKSLRVLNPGCGSPGIRSRSLSRGRKLA